MPVSTRQMCLSSGTTLGPYSGTATIGEGGHGRSMTRTRLGPRGDQVGGIGDRLTRPPSSARGVGQVYRVRDTKLERDVVGVVSDDWFTEEEQGSAHAS